MLFDKQKPKTGMRVLNRIFYCLVILLLVVTTILYTPPTAVNGVFKAPKDSSFRKRSFPIANHTEVFCKSSHLGCFDVPLLESPLSVEYNFMTVSWCVAFCQSNNCSFAAIRRGKKCLCSKQFTEVAVPKTVDLWTGCDFICAGDKTTRCGGKSKADVFLIKGECVQAPFSDSYITQKSQGCFQLPENHDLVKYRRVVSTSDCIVACERERHPISVYRKPDVCFCGNMSESFNLTHKALNCENHLNVEVFKTTVEDLRCGNIGFLPPQQFPKTALVSYPGSGNTWTRFMLEKATGFYTGSIYGDMVLLNKGFLGEMLVNSDRTDLTKDHFFYAKTGILNMCKSAVAVVRNPYHAFISHFNLIHSTTTNPHIGMAPPDVFAKDFTTEKIRKLLAHWTLVPQKVIESGKPFLIIYYEDLVVDPISTIKQIIEFVPNSALRPPNLNERLACLSQDLQGSAKRDSRKIANPYQPAVRMMINNAIKDLRLMLRKAGVKRELPMYENDPQFSTVTNG